VPSQKPATNAQKTRFGRNVGILRQKAGLTQEQLAESTGVSARYVQSLEAGEYLPTLPTLAKLKKALNCDWNALFQGCDLEK
jgi:transcriptional regulator with XRE-family HTH domain